MSLLTAVRETYGGFKSLLIGMRITFGQAIKPSITVQYPHQTLKMPARFRGHLKLILDQETGKSRCTACGLCVKACPSDCIELDGVKREGEKRKSVTEYELDFTKCSLCGSCVDACPSDAIEYSKDYNVVSFNREDFSRMDIVKRLEDEAVIWRKNHPPQAAASAAAANPATPAATVAPATPAAAPAPEAKGPPPVAKAP